jgi:hypothetical protein
MSDLVALYFLVAAAIQWAESIMRKIDGVYR